MTEYEKIRNQIFQIASEDEFEALALKVFKMQYNYVNTYRDYCNLLGKTNPKSLSEIPFLPIELFKSHRIIDSGLEPNMTFLSSGTTNSIRSSHFVADVTLYEESFQRAFHLFFGELDGKVVLALLPNYIEQGSSSLIYMVSNLIAKSNHPYSGFFLTDYDSLLKTIEKAKSEKLDIILFGVSYALLDLAERQADLKGVRIIETGGMKGRRKEMIKTELHDILSQQLNVPFISSEYGMTELLSQAYSFQHGIFKTPPWMKILIRDAEDPFSWLIDGKTGGISVIDLANLYSCSFIHTQDLGKKSVEGFQLIGRFDHSDIRGCNLLVNN